MSFFLSLRNFQRTDKLFLKKMYTNALRKAVFLVNQNIITPVLENCTEILIYVINLVSNVLQYEYCDKILYNTIIYDLPAANDSGT